MDTRLWDELDVLSAKLERAEAAHLHARSGGDADNTFRSRLQLDAIMAERDRVLRQLSVGLSAD
jgi:hypothetical protein